jgi:hypothetical protein
MNWNILQNEDRLALWKNLRADLHGQSIEIILPKIAEFFQPFPYESRTIDYYTPASWPTPWEILYHGTFCISSISLLIYYTITLINPDISVDLVLVDCQTGVFMIPLVENKFVLNYELGMISMYSAIQTDFRVVKTYTRDQIKKIS